MKKMLPAALMMLAACSKKDTQITPRPTEPVWKLTEIAGAGESTFFYYNSNGEPSAWVTRTASGTDSSTVAWAGGKLVFTYLFFGQQQRIDRSFLYTGNRLTRIRYHNFDHSGQWSVTDYDSLVYSGNQLAELHVVNAGARNQMFKLYWKGGNVVRSESFDVIAETEVRTGAIKYQYTDQPALARVFPPWCYFIWTGRDFAALSENERSVEEGASALGTLRWRNSYGHAYLSGGRLESMNWRREDFSAPATADFTRQFAYQLFQHR
ncbi:hypothetical protein [Chitinophaga rhizosphaerae]|uniref:hypothetical protein n=1 Tax=Chitinophaga rhizosphaerae TaxID=1864947 RepID=UPI000F8064DB|nr:hypothetical protein [Chitinophaga rhizosphaerae]